MGIMKKNRPCILRPLVSDACSTLCSMNSQKSKGFTLIEVVIVIVLIAIIAGIAALIILQGVRGYAAEDQRSSLHYQSRLAMERMTREIRLARSRTAADVPVMTASNFQYINLQGSQMGFRLNGNSIERTEDNGATWQPLANGVISLTFRYLQQDGATTATAATLWFVAIDLTVQQGTESLAMHTQVHPRNLR